MNDIVIHTEYGTLEIHPAFLQMAPLVNIRKMIKLVFAAPSENLAAIQTLDTLLAGAVQDSKDALAAAVKNYANGYRDITYRKRQGDTDTQIRAMRRQNTKLRGAVTRCKTTYQKTQKILTIYQNEKEKHLCIRTSQQKY